jgi:hypothetical protein
MAASGVKSEETLVPRQSAAGEINLAMAMQRPVGRSGLFPVPKAKRLLFPDKVRLVK